MKLSEMIDNVCEVANQSTLAGASLVMCIAIIGVAALMVLIVYSIVYPFIGIPIALALIIGRVAYAAIKAK